MSVHAIPWGLHLTEKQAFHLSSPWLGSRA